MPASTATDARFTLNVISKALVLFLAANVAFGMIDPMPHLGRLSAYNVLFPGRLRLPYGENPERSYNLSLFQLEAMFASHEIAAGAKSPNEYRVVVIGDSSVWGFRLKADQTLTAHLNAAGYTTPDGRRVRAYNLGYPIMSLTQDLLLLEWARRYQPDMIAWLVTLESFPYDQQLFPPLLQHNPGPVRALIADYHLKLDPDDPGFVRESPWTRTLLGQRRALADLVRLQMYGVLWAATGVDQDIPENFTPRMEDLPADPVFHGLQPPVLAGQDLAFDVLCAGLTAAGNTPVLVVNEPMFISQGDNSDIRYNFFYPRWAYDQYRALLAERSRQEVWPYLDLWDAIPAAEFTDSAVHLTPSGSARLAARVGSAILDLAEATRVGPATGGSGCAQPSS